MYVEENTRTCTIMELYTYMQIKYKNNAEPGQQAQQQNLVAYLGLGGEMRCSHVVRTAMRYVWYTGVILVNLSSTGPPGPGGFGEGTPSPRLCAGVPPSW